jgi:hypothetical protein
MHPTRNYSCPPFCQKAGWAHIIEICIDPSRVGRSGSVDRLDAAAIIRSRQPHDGEPVADGNVLPRNTRTSCVDGGATAASHVCRSVSLLRLLPFSPGKK